MVAFLLALAKSIYFFWILKNSQETEVQFAFSKSQCLYVPKVGILRWCHSQIHVHFISLFLYRSKTVKQITILS